MKRKMLYFLTSILIISFPGLMFLNAQEDLTFSDFDVDGNSLITRTEFINVFTDNFIDDWDNVDNEYLDDEDFFRIVYKIWDVDNDDVLSIDEWTNAYESFFGDYLVVEQDVLNIGNERPMVYQEFHKIIDDADIFEELDFDKDSRINRIELARAIFNHYDKNESNFLELNEYLEFDAYFMDI